MVRSYDVAAASLATGSPLKWVDNLLSRHSVEGVEQGLQGTTRRLAPRAVLRIAVIRILVDSLGLSVARALPIAEQICTSPAHAADLEDEMGTVTVDVPRLERQLAGRLADAVESAPRRTRGRPPAGRLRNRED